MFNLSEETVPDGSAQDTFGDHRRDIKTGTALRSERNAMTNHRGLCAVTCVVSYVTYVAPVRRLRPVEQSISKQMANNIVNHFVLIDGYVTTHPQIRVYASPAGIYGISPWTQLECAEYCECQTPFDLRDRVNVGKMVVNPCKFQAVGTNVIDAVAAINWLHDLAISWDLPHTTFEVRSHYIYVFCVPRAGAQLWEQRNGDWYQHPEDNFSPYPLLLVPG